jgi:hypothetical protein
LSLTLQDQSLAGDLGPQSEQKTDRVQSIARGPSYKTRILHPHGNLECQLYDSKLSILFGTLRPLRQFLNPKCGTGEATGFSVLKNKLHPTRRCSGTGPLGGCPELFGSVPQCLQTLLRVPYYRSRNPGSIPGATRFSEKYWFWNGVHSAS